MAVGAVVNSHKVAKHPAITGSAGCSGAGPAIDGAASGRLPDVPTMTFFRFTGSLSVT